MQAAPFRSGTDGARRGLPVAVPDLSDLRATRPTAIRLRRALHWLATPLRPFAVALVPDRSVRREVVAARYGWPLLGAVVCACIAALALGARLDVGPAVRAEDASPPPATATASASNGTSKAAEIKTDREIDEAIARRTSVTRVKLGLGAVLGTPFRVLALALALLVLGRFVGGTPTMPRTLTVASLAAIPGAVRSLVTALVAWRQPSVVPDEMDSLLQFPAVIPDGHPVLERLFAGVDVFTWWSLLILAIGMCAAADVKRSKGVAAIAIGFALYLGVTRLIMGGA
jgi:hypothetical protein